jgi:hypothetical protein
VKAASRGEEAAHLQKAAECDLDSLQAMALSNEELVGLLEGSVSDLPSAWLDAGEPISCLGPLLWGRLINHPNRVSSSLQDDCTSDALDFIKNTSIHILDIQE